MIELGSNSTIIAPSMNVKRYWHSIALFNTTRSPDKQSSHATSSAMLGLMRMVECTTVAYVRQMASVSMYDRGAGNRSIVVCGGSNIQHGFGMNSCEELPIDARGRPAAISWRSFAPLPFELYRGCMLQINSKVRLCKV